MLGYMCQGSHAKLINVEWTIRRVLCSSNSISKQSARIRPQENVKHEKHTCWQESCVTLSNKTINQKCSKLYPLYVGAQSLKKP